MTSTADCSTVGDSRLLQKAVNIPKAEDSRVFFASLVLICLVKKF